MLAQYRIDKSKQGFSHTDAGKQNKLTFFNYLCKNAGTLTIGITVRNKVFISHNMRERHHQFCITEHDVNENINRFSSWRFNRIQQVNRDRDIARSYEKRFFFLDHRNNGRFVILHIIKNCREMGVIFHYFSNKEVLNDL